MMKVSKRSRKFHDPWGNKSGNKYGSPIRYQYLIGKSSLSPTDHRPATIDGGRYYIDEIAVHESTANQYVRSGKFGAEKLRR